MFLPCYPGSLGEPDLNGKTTVLNCYLDYRVQGLGVNPKGWNQWRTSAQKSLPEGMLPPRAGLMEC
jgi:hypothetical protein